MDSYLSATEKKELVAKCGLTLTNDVLNEYLGAFKMYDKNNDKRIQPQELRNVIQASNANPSEKQLSKMISEITKREDGLIYFPEFVCYMHRNGKATKADMKKDITDAFKVFDKDKNGHLGLSELRTVLTTMGEKMTEEEVAEMFEEVDLDGDGKVTYAEFADLFSLTIEELVQKNADRKKRLKRRTRN